MCSVGALSRPVYDVTGVHGFSWTGLTDTINLISPQMFRQQLFIPEFVLKRTEETFFDPEQF